MDILTFYAKKRKKPDNQNLIKAYLICCNTYCVNCA